MKVLTPTVLTYIKVVLLVALVPAIVGFVIVLAERRFMGFMQVRLGPNRVGPKGTLQGLADLIKLVTKEPQFCPSKGARLVDHPTADCFMQPVKIFDGHGFAMRGCPFPETVDQIDIVEAAVGVVVHGVLLRRP